MARYAEGHKEQTRARILDTARRQFREHGFDSASIDTVMKAAGLTRGAFYAHFGSKEELVAEVLKIESGLTRALGEIEPGHESAERAAQTFETYLLRDRDQRIQCPLVAHPMDSVRGGTNRMELYGEQIEGLVAAIERATSTGDTDPTEDQDDAVLLGALAIGAAIVSASVSSPEIAERVERVCAREIRRRLTAD